MACQLLANSKEDALRWEVFRNIDGVHKHMKRIKEFLQWRRGICEMVVRESVAHPRITKLVGDAAPARGERRPQTSSP